VRTEIKFRFKITKPQIDTRKKVTTPFYSTKETVTFDEFLSHYYYLDKKNLVGKCFRNEAEIVLRMWVKFKVVPFMFIPGRHPERLRKWNNNRITDVFMKINYGYDPAHDTTFTSEFKHYLSEDAGADYFQVVTNMANNDVFYFSPNLSKTLRKCDVGIDFQLSERDTFINEQLSVKNKTSLIDGQSKILFDVGVDGVESFNAEVHANLVELKADRVEAIAAVYFILIK
jgi:hypothetical protein